MTIEIHDKEIHSLYKVNNQMNSFGVGNDFSFYKRVSSIEFVISNYSKPKKEF